MSPFSDSLDDEAQDAQEGGGEIADLHRLARLWGVATHYHDGFGDHRQPSREALLAVLAALGAPVERPTDVVEALRARRRDYATRFLPPSAVAWDGACPVVPLTVPASAAAVPVDGRLVLEAGEAVPFRLEAEETPVRGRRRVDGRDWVRRSLWLADSLPPGHHRLEIEVAGHRGSLRCVSAPLRAQPHPDREWGVFLPLHALRVHPGAGLGDLTLLARLARWAGGMGASTIGCLPLLAGFLDTDRRPFEPSPYAPASRLFWNELWVDLAAVPELPDCRAAREALTSAETSARRRELATGEESHLVDYGAERAWRRPVWQALADRFFAHSSADRREDLELLLRERPELMSYAVFRATGDRFGAPWQEWPEAERGGEAADPVPADDLFSDPGVSDSETLRLTRLHLYAQLVAHQQMGRLRERAREAGTDLYLDLPLGVHGSSYDVWRYRELFARQASAGAPPDAFFVRGQDWGFPPLSPERLRRDGPAHLQQVLAHSMGACGVLRLDHAMQLERLFWIPSGGEPADGTYVRSPREELLATLVLESRRARCAVVAEDLGTVSDGFRDAMERHGLARMFVLPFELRPNPFSAIAPVPEGSLASLGTHDTATFAGFWHGRDLELRRQLELIKAEDAERLAGYREILRHALVAELRSRGRLSRVGEPIAVQVARATHEALAESPASWLLVNLEDLWGEEEPQNVPGTGPERPNWRRRARKTLADLTTDREVRGQLETLDLLRQGSTEAETEPERPESESDSEHDSGEEPGA